MSSTSAAVSSTPARLAELGDRLRVGQLGPRRSRAARAASWTSEPRTRGSSAGDLGGHVRPRRRLDPRQPEQALEVEAVAAAGVRAQRAVGQALRRRPRPGRRRRAGPSARRGSAVPGAPARGAARGRERRARQHVAERRGRVHTAQHAGAAVGPEAVEQPLGRAHGGGEVAGERAPDPVDRRPAGTRVGQLSQSTPPERISSSRARVIAT